ncbi:hypothetical protein F2Q69_00030763 [Brassica cretica]|uniref:Uncharacterized protein n=1 Tax=Brassica cretica TaxID=69181 RepID=A0A8S9RVE9_BRACR|nr:hypothetical protein F2Q69_00030763 [Brassica cretica]
MWELNTFDQTWYCKLPRTTLLLQCDPILHLFSDLMEYSPNVLFRALSTSIGSGASSECVLVVSGGLAKGFGCGLSALIHALSIFGICTRNVRGAHRSMGTGGCRSTVVSCCQLTTGSVCRSMLIHKGLGGCGCLAANSSWVMILTALHDATDSECVVDRCSGKLADRFWLKSVDRCSKSDVDRHQLSIDELASMSIDEERLPLQIERSKLAGSDENNS